MTAAEARKKAITIRSEGVTQQYTIIKQMIETAVSKGELACCVYNAQIIKEVRAQLVSEGYKIEPTQTNRDESYTTITW